MVPDPPCEPIVRATGNALDKVTGLVFAVTEDELEAADEYQIPGLRRDSVTLASGHTAWVYLSAMMALSHDPLWPRAGDWPSFDDAAGRVDAAILGVPAWRTSLSPTGAHATPAAVREALRRFSPTLLGAPPIDLNDVLAIVDAGDVVEPDGPEGEASVRSRVGELRARAEFVIALGGDNSATFAVAQGMDAAGLITLDAHFDLRDGISNGSPVRRLVEGGLDPRRIVQVGIADFANSAAYARRAAELGITVITLDDVRRRGVAEVMAEALARRGIRPWCGAPRHRRRRVRPRGGARAAPRRCPAGSRPGSCAHSCGPRHPIPGCAAPISSKSTRPRTRRTDAPSVWPRCACWNSSPEGRCCHDRTRARAPCEVGLGR